MGFARQEYWSGLLFPSLGDLPNPGIELTSPALQVDSLMLSHQGRTQVTILAIFTVQLAQLVKNPPAMQETPV